MRDWECDTLTWLYCTSLEAGKDAFVSQRMTQLKQINIPVMADS